MKTRCATAPCTYEIQKGYPIIQEVLSYIECSVLGDSSSLNDCPTHDQDSVFLFHNSFTPRYHWCSVLSLTNTACFQTPETTSWAISHHRPFNWIAILSDPLPCLIHPSEWQYEQRNTALKNDHFFPSVIPSSILNHPLHSIRSKKWTVIFTPSLHFQSTRFYILSSYTSHFLWILQQ